MAVLLTFIVLYAGFGVSYYAYRRGLFGDHGLIVISLLVFTVVGISSISAMKQRFLASATDAPATSQRGHTIVPEPSSPLSAASTTIAATSSPASGADIERPALAGSSSEPLPTPVAMTTAPESIPSSTASNAQPLPTSVAVPKAKPTRTTARAGAGHRRQADKARQLSMGDQVSRVQHIPCADFLHQNRPGGSDYHGPPVPSCP